MAVFRAGLAQIDCVLGDVEANLATHLDTISEARRSGVDLLIFPELSLTGYGLRDLVASVARPIHVDDPVLRPLVRASRHLDLVVSLVESDGRHRNFISAVYLSGGDILHVHRKVYLPTYGMFQEGRFLAWGDRVGAFDTRFGRVGLLICEDFWHVSPPYLLWLDGADLFLFISASPARGLTEGDQLGSVAWVERINQAYASLFTSYVLHTNRVGFEDGVMLGGRATVYDADGELIAHGPYHEPSLTLADLDLAGMARTRYRLPLLRDERTDLVRRELRRLVWQATEGSGQGPFPGGAS